MTVKIDRVLPPPIYFAKYINKELLKEGFFLLNELSLKYSQIKIACIYSVELSMPHECTRQLLLNYWFCRQV